MAGGPVRRGEAVWKERRRGIGGATAQCGWSGRAARVRRCGGGARKGGVWATEMDRRHTGERLERIEQTSWAHGEELSEPDKLGTEGIGLTHWSNFDWI